MPGTVTTVRGVFVPGNDWRAVIKWVGDNSYAEGGEPLSLKEVGFGPEAVYSYSNILYVKNATEQAAFEPINVLYDGTKVKVFDADTGKELTKEKDLSKLEVGIEVICTSR